MKFTGFASLFVFAVAALADTVAYDQTYDNAATSLDVVACSDGSHGMENQGFSTIGSLPKFPFVGAVGAIEGYNSVNCGTCWQLTYAGTGKTINVIGIDHAAPGTFNIALSAMNTLTNNQAVHLGRVTVTSKQVAKSVCGL
ncbi:Cerato-platanin [Favolaschia claudopus]|uniref:Cerato-platanin n=1 Tax=Favolaschia claudopus TaxID=2862362 RepID=A0AAW0C1Z1_9AGAR